MAMLRKTDPAVTEDREEQTDEQDDEPTPDEHASLSADRSLGEGSVRRDGSRGIHSSIIGY